MWRLARRHRALPLLHEIKRREMNDPQHELLPWPALLRPCYFISIRGLPTMFSQAALPNNLRTNSQPVHRHELTHKPQRAYKIEGVAKHLQAAYQPAYLVRLFFSFGNSTDHSPDCSECWFNRLEAQTLFEHREHIFSLLHRLRLLLWLLMTLVQVVGCCLSTGQLLRCLPIF